jgi:hypothetical protein
MAHILLVSTNTGPDNTVASALRDQSHCVDVVGRSADLPRVVGDRKYDVVITDMTGVTDGGFGELDALRAALSNQSQLPGLLCMTKDKRRFLQIEDRGARYVWTGHFEAEAVSDGVDVVLLERAKLLSTGPLLSIYHRFHRRGTICTPGEEIAGIALSYRSKEHYLQIGTEPCLLVDLAARQRLPYNLAQLSRALARDPFTVQHARFGGGMKRGHRQRSSDSIKTDIHRIRLALTEALEAAHLNLPADSILVSEPVGRSVQYRLRARVKWLHFA